MSRSSPSFEEDMRLIREKRNVSREMLHRQTKVALENIELFEAGDLERHPHFNEVYLRALVRAYAEVLDISKEMALQALDRSRSGIYRGELGDAYLEREGYAEREEVSLADPEHQPEESAETVREGEEDLEDRSSSVDRSEDADDPDDTAAGDAAAAEPQTGSPDETPSTSPRPRPRAEQSSAAGFKDWMLQGGTSSVVMGVAGLVIVVLALWVLASLVPSSSPPASAPDEADAAADTTEVAAGDEVDRQPPVAVIGDSLDVTVVAARDKLEPIRVRLDEGSWNPYWIEQGDSMSFTAHNEVALRRYLPRARVRVESLEWPIQATSDYDTLIVSRQLVQERIDSLSAVRGGTQ